MNAVKKKAHDNVERWFSRVFLRTEGPEIQLGEKKLFVLYCSKQAPPPKMRIFNFGVYQI